MHAGIIIIDEASISSMYNAHWLEFIDGHSVVEAYVVPILRFHMRVYAEAHAEGTVLDRVIEHARGHAT